MKKIKPLALLLFLLPLITSLSCLPTTPPNPPNAVALQTTVVTQNLNLPWEILWGPDNYIWMTERDKGQISRVNPVTGQVIPVYKLPYSMNGGESGLEGMVLHPDFAKTPYVYLAYVGVPGIAERVERYTYSNGTLINPLLITEAIPAHNQHTGSRLVIVSDKLFVSTGDATNANGSNPQNVQSLGGKILRYNLDGSIPSDNPFPGSPVWSLGHRNPQGLVFTNNFLYSTEHGGYDELNIIQPGRNYGWPLIDGYSDEAAEIPVHTSKNTIDPIDIWPSGTAPSGMDYYNNDAIPQWKGCLLIATLAAKRLLQVKLDPGYQTVTYSSAPYFINEFGRLRDVCISPSGDVYICTSNANNDQIIKVSPAPAGSGSVVK